MVCGVCGTELWGWRKHYTLFVHKVAPSFSRPSPACLLLRHALRLRGVARKVGCALRRTAKTTREDNEAGSISHWKGYPGDWPSLG